MPKYYKTGHMNSSQSTSHLIYLMDPKEVK
uniref:Uncharacterized protein n=1 Tax=Anguilla anguilla TaxID=7936 RepID=A0A0E9R3S3_ANGAN